MGNRRNEELTFDETATMAETDPDRFISDRNGCWSDFDCHGDGLIFWMMGFVEISVMGFSERVSLKYFLEYMLWSLLL